MSSNNNGLKTSWWLVCIGVGVVVLMLAYTCWGPLP